MTKTLILRQNKNDYFFPYLKNQNIYSTLKQTNYFIRMVHKLFVKLGYPSSLIFNVWKYDINTYDNIIIFDYGYRKDITKFIKSRNNHCKINLFFFNKITQKNHESFSDKNIDLIWSFDREDVLKYKLKYNTPLYSKNVVLPNINITNDIIFLGKAKNREKKILEIKDFSEKNGISTNFKIIKNEKDYIDYNEYLVMIAKSKAILDITNENQKGLTLRFMEALFFNKKIITNNKEIKKFDFYRSNNIFILGEDKLTDLRVFLDVDYERIDQDIIDYYDIEKWIKRFEDLNEEIL